MPDVLSGERSDRSASSDHNYRQDRCRTAQRYRHAAAAIRSIVSEQRIDIGDGHENDQNQHQRNGAGPEARRAERQ